MHRCMALADCIEFIAENSHLGNQWASCMERLLDSAANDATVGQLVPVLNGYADFYQTELCFIPCNKDKFIDRDQIATYEGTVSQSTQGPHHDHIVFIMYNFEQSQFGPLYIIGKSNHPHTCFDRADQSIFVHVRHFLCAYNGEYHVQSSLII